jgi:hypothetical protein
MFDRNVAFPMRREPALFPVVGRKAYGSGLCRARKPRNVEFVQFDPE